MLNFKQWINESADVLPADHLKSGVGEYGAGWWREFNPQGLDEKNWAKTVDFSEPVQISIYSDGGALFSDGHHRVMAGKILDKSILVKIVRNDLKPEIWKEYLDRLNHGFKDYEINPEKVNLNRAYEKGYYQIPNIQIMQQGRTLGLQRESLYNFYLEKMGMTV